MPSITQPKTNHVHLETVAEAKIGLEFEERETTDNSNKPTRKTDAHALRATVTRKDLDPSDQVRLVFTNDSEFFGNSNSGYQYKKDSNTQIVDLEYAGEGRFVAPLQDVTLRTNGYTGVSSTHQRVAVVINGEWQKDPSQPTPVSDFNLDLYNTSPALPLPKNFTLERQGEHAFLTFADSTSIPKSLLAMYKVNGEWKSGATDIVRGGGTGGLTSMRIDLGEVPQGSHVEMAIRVQRDDGQMEWLNPGYGQNFISDI